MTAADRAVSIFRAGLFKPHVGLERAEQPRWRHSRSDFARWLDERPVPAITPPSLITPGSKIRSKKFGTWLYEHNRPFFSVLYEAWKAEQEAKP